MLNEHHNESRDSVKDAFYNATPELVPVGLRWFIVCAAVLWYLT